MQSAEVGVWVWLQGDEKQSVLWAELSSVYQQHSWYYYNILSHKSETQNEK